MTSNQAKSEHGSSEHMSAAHPLDLFDDQHLRSSVLFRSSNFEAIRPLLQNCVIRELKSEEVLVAEGRPNKNLFVVIEGYLSVRLSSAESVPLTEVGPGGIVGELSIIDGQPTSAFVIASVPSTVLVIDEELVWILVNSSHAVAANLLYTLSQRMRSGNDMIFERSERIEQYHYHATVDALTGLFNRHWLSSMLPRQMHRSRMCAEPFCILMIDIDEFKQYNDASGHVAGDTALCAVGDCLRQTLRPTDMAARYGGEEFIVLLPKCTTEQALMVAERLRASIESTAITHSTGQALPGVTISLGVAELPAAGTVEAFVSAADEALYRAKRSGRNRVCG